jgi:outer membrane murein-binding lipoprotein Lpp
MSAAEQLLCDQCQRLRAHNEQLQSEVEQLYAALRISTKDNIEMRQRLQSWADDFSTDGATGAPTRRTN